MLTVTKKIGGAVVRNRIKRRVREAFRHLAGDLPDVDLNVVARASAAEASAAQLAAALRTGLASVTRRPS